MKSFTDIEQSNKLAEILPLESADMYWWYNGQRYYVETKEHNDFQKSDIPCWSLAALIDVIPKEIVYKGKIVFLEFHIWETSLEYTNDGGYTLHATESYNNPIDACCEMIIKLHELKML